MTPERDPGVPNPAADKKETPLHRPAWPDVYLAAYVGPDPERGLRECGPAICVIPTRYGGGYEGGRFAAIPVDALNSAAFGEDVAAAHWWDAHLADLGLGATPDEALLDWFAKHGAAIADRFGWRR